MSDICLNPKKVLDAWACVSPCLVLDTWVQCLSIRYLSELDNSISSYASQILMCNAYLGLMTTEKCMSYEPSDMLSGYLCEPKCQVTVARFGLVFGSMAIVNFL